MTVTALQVLKEPNGTVSNVHTKFPTPDVVSVAVVLKVIGPRYQPFDPKGPVTEPVTLGSWVSTFAVNVSISELSRNEESAQYVKLFVPCFSGTLQIGVMQANICPFNVPSIAMIL